MRTKEAKHFTKFAKRMDLRSRKLPWGQVSVCGVHSTGPDAGAGGRRSAPHPSTRTRAGEEQVMNALTRWDPFKEMEDLQSRFAKIFGLTPVRAGNGGQELMTVTEWAPSVDIIEDDKEWLVKADLPEVKKEDVKVNVENGVLTITGERKFEKEEKDKKYHRIERSYGNFLRSFTLPEGADGAKVTADFKDGVLKVHLPKNEKAKPKTVEVKVT
jgi:HSP20 family protein